MIDDRWLARRLPLGVGLMVALVSLATTGSALAEVRLPALFTDHMVLQRDMNCRVWGWADPGEAVSVAIAGQSHTARADADGRWSVQLTPLAVGGPHTLSVSGSNQVTINDVLVGEVWLCSGQSNMAWTVARAIDADLEIRAANYPNIRFISVPQVGTQETQHDFQGSWAVCSPETVGNFSAVGYFFGRQLNKTLDVPIGLIDNSWGGSAAEAWVPREALAGNELYAPLLARWDELAQTYDHAKALEAYEARLKTWQQAAQEARRAGKPAPQRPLPPRDMLAGQHRPGNLYHGVLKPVIGYGMRGAIWYQGESNAGRAYQYRDLFPRMIQLWRNEWQIGDFPFYWVQLADFKAETPEPVDSDWAELREAQTMTMNKLPNTGEAVIIDSGEGNDIHPRNKQVVARRLARWALARDYSVDIVYRSPQLQSQQVEGNKIVLTFDHVGGGLRTLDTAEVIGFAIAGADRKFVWATAKIVAPNRVEVSSPEVAAPVAVRYAWADNPVCNVISVEGLPVTPFRTDDWPGITAEAR